MPRILHRNLASTLLPVLLMVACGSDESAPAPATPGSGGSTATGGTSGSSGSTGKGGTAGSKGGTGGAAGGGAAGASGDAGDDASAGAAGSGGTSIDASVEGGSGGSVGPDATSDGCGPFACSPDHSVVVDCNGLFVHKCQSSELCAEGACLPACEASKVLRTSVGCDYYPLAMSAATWSQAYTGCFAVFVANTWTLPVHLTVERKGVALDASTFAFIPTGSGANITYTPLDVSTGLLPNQVAILFLSGPTFPNPLNPTAVECPDGIQPAITDSTQVDGTGIGDAFHITTDYPVVANQILPYGGGSAGVTGASLLLPTSVWDTNYIAVNAYAKSTGNTSASSPSLNVVAMDDDTQIKVLAHAAVVGGGGVPATAQNSVLNLTLNKGQFVQITQPDELTGSPIESTKPIGLMAGHECMFIPSNVKYCDHAEQQIPPVKALGSEYVAVPYRPRTSDPENVPWRIIGGVDGTQLSFDPPSAHVGATVNRGEILEFTTQEPFVVQSQDASHPFLVTGYMTSSQAVQDGYGDPEFVRMVPPQQYLQRYVFFTDPTYPETNLVMVRVKGNNGFADVKLDCAGTLSGWQPVGGSTKYEYARVDLVRHNFESQNGCDNGRHEMTSAIPFGLWIWGWGTPETAGSPYTENVSYGYPAGENVLQLNSVSILPIPE